MRNFFERCPNIEIPFFVISNPDFSLFFFSNYRHCLVLKIPFPDHVSPEIPNHVFLKIPDWKFSFPVQRQIPHPPYNYKCSKKSYLKCHILSNKIVCFCSKVFSPALIFSLFLLKYSDAHLFSLPLILFWNIKMMHLKRQNSRSCIFVKS